MVKRYSLLCLFFRLEDTYDVAELTQTLTRGLDSLSTAIPHLKGHVVFEKHSEQDSGHAKILPLDKHITLVSKDVRRSPKFFSLEELANAQYPFSMLDPHQLVPESMLPHNYTSEGPYEASEARPARVLVVQATFLRDGAILTFCSCHLTMDMNGLGQTICLLAKACRGEAFSDREVKDANQPRRNAIPLLGDDYQPGKEAKYFIFQPRESTKNTSEPAPPARWAYLKFKAESVEFLKAEASKQHIVPYITTNDALSAFLWQRITKSRASRLGTNIESELNRQSSARRLLGLSDGYLGHMVISTHNHEVDVWQQPLGFVAGKLRQSLQDSETLKFHVQAMATMLVRTEDKRSIGYGASLDPERDVVLSSWAELKVCQVSFGPVFGFAVAARRPGAYLSPGLAYLLPKDHSGDMAAAVCLRDDEWEQLRNDDEFIRVAQYIG